VNSEAGLTLVVDIFMEDVIDEVIVLCLVLAQNAAKGGRTDGSINELMERLITVVEMNPLPDLLLDESHGDVMDGPIEWRWIDYVHFGNFYG